VIADAAGVDRAGGCGGDGIGGGGNVVDRHAEIAGEQIHGAEWNDAHDGLGAGEGLADAGDGAIAAGDDDGVDVGGARRADAVGQRAGGDFVQGGGLAQMGAQRLGEGRVGEQAAGLFVQDQREPAGTGFGRCGLVRHVRGAGCMAHERRRAGQGCAGERLNWGRATGDRVQARVRLRIGAERCKALACHARASPTSRSPF
jgi:hypothetical protein